MFKSTSLIFKLSAAFMSIAFIVAAVGYYEVRSVNILSGTVRSLVTDDFARTDNLEMIRSRTAEIENAVLRFSRTTSFGAADTAVDGAYADEVGMSYSSLRQAFEQYRTAVTRDDRMHDTHHVDSGEVFSDLESGASDIYSKAREVLTATSPTQANQSLQQLYASIDDYNLLVEEVYSAESAHIKDRTVLAEDQINNLTRIMLLLMVAVLLFAIVLSIIVAGRIARATKRLKAGAARLANGDFSQQIQVKSKDELGQLAHSFNNMSSRLKVSYQRLALETIRNKTLLESLGEGVISVDEDGKINLINNKAIDVLELEGHEDLIGSSLDEVVTLYDERSVKPKKARLPSFRSLKKDHVFNSVYGIYRKDTTKLLIELTASPVILDDKAAGAVMTLRDVTKIKEVDRMKTDFISLASHQLRTPLSAIKWFTEMLIAGDAGKLKSEQMEFARNIFDSTERMIALVNALLNISRIESGRIIIDPKPTDLKELINGIVNDLKAKTEHKQQTLAISVHSELPKINLDPRLIGQVYLNLLTNAIKYTPKGGEICLFVSRKGNQVLSQITDNGYGIPKEQQNRVFQRFFRATNAVKVETDGTGLGLYLIKSVIESSGGKIWFQSEEGQGTTFWFSIPVSGMKAKEGEVTLDT